MFLDKFFERHSTAGVGETWPWPNDQKLPHNLAVAEWIKDGRAVWPWLIFDSKHDLSSQSKIVILYFVKFYHFCIINHAFS